MLHGFIFGQYGDQRRGGRSQEHDRAGYIHGLSNPVQGRDSLHHIGADRGIRKVLFGSGSADESGSHRIHQNVVLSPFDG